MQTTLPVLPLRPLDPKQNIKHTILGGGGGITLEFTD